LRNEQELSGADFRTAKSRVFSIVGRPEIPWEQRELETIYQYHDESGTVLYQVLRYQMTSLGGGTACAHAVSPDGSVIAGVGINGHLFKYVNSVLTDLQVDDHVAIMGVNDAGTVATCRFPFLPMYVDGAGVHAISLPSGSGCAHAINNAGQIVGVEHVTVDGQSIQKPFRFTIGGALEELPLAATNGPDWTAVVPMAINAAGDVFGYAMGPKRSNCSN